jgi:hypothetical protein
LLGKISTIQRIVQPGLRFIRFSKGFVDLVYECGFVPSTCPCFGDHRFDGTRASPDLVGQRGRPDTLSILETTWQAPY